MCEAKYVLAIFELLTLQFMMLDFVLENLMSYTFFFTVTSTLDYTRQLNVNHTVRLQWKVGHD